MDCYFHHAVPAVAPCRRCGNPICATCCSAEGDCPSCRLAARIDAAAAERGQLSGAVGPSSPPPPRSSGPPPAPPRPAPVTVGLRPESRALAALGYPFWPLAVLALFDPSRSDFVRRNAWQALGFNAGMYALGWLLATIAAIPLIGISAWPLLPFVIPVTVVASIVFGIKTWHGDEVRVPFVSDVVDARLGPPVS